MKYTAFEVVLRKRGRTVGWVGMYTTRREARRHKRDEIAGTAFIVRSRVDLETWRAIGGDPGDTPPPAPFEVHLVTIEEAAAEAA